MVNIIFEGVDNLGKSTLINKIIQKYNSTKDIFLIHATGPIDKTLSKGPALKFQLSTFDRCLTKIETLLDVEKVSKKEIFVIQDRSEIGEYVYGPKYRNENRDDILNYLLEKKNYKGQYEYSPFALIPTLVILLTADPKFAANNDDNLSLNSNSENKVEEIKNEMDLFKECMKTINPVNYLELKVDNNDNFINADILSDIIFDKINSINITNN